jgi:hypothetical protein
MQEKAGTSTTGWIRYLAEAVVITEGRRALLPVCEKLGTRCEGSRRLELGTGTKR